MVKGDFSLLRSEGGGTFCLHFWNLHKILALNTELDSAQISTQLDNI